MRFANLHFNYFFILLFFMLGIFYVSAKKKRSLLERFSDKKLLKNIAGSYSRKKDINSKILLGFCLLLMIIAIMRPQWGFVWQDVQRSGADIFVAVDVSKSMLTKDVLPSRLDRAKLAIEDLTSELQGDRIGLIAFAGSAFVQCPLTIDYNGFLLTASELEAGIIPHPGTNIEEAIDKAVDSFESGSQGTSRHLIIITDGESHEGDPIKAAKLAKENNITIHTIGVGTAEGELISIQDEQGKTSFLKDEQGRVVKSRINEPLLQQIAQQSKGTYIKATPIQFGLDFLYTNKIMETSKDGKTTTREKKMLERFQLPLVLALVLLFIEPLLSKKNEEGLSDE